MRRLHAQALKARAELQVTALGGGIFTAATSGGGGGAKPDKHSSPRGEHASTHTLVVIKRCCGGQTAQLAVVTFARQPFALKLGFASMAWQNDMPLGRHACGTKIAVPLSQALFGEIPAELGATSCVDHLICRAGGSTLAMVSLVTWWVVILVLFGLLLFDGWLSFLFARASRQFLRAFRLYRIWLRRWGGARVCSWWLYAYLVQPRPGLGSCVFYRNNLQLPHRTVLC